MARAYWNPITAAVLLPVPPMGDEGCQGLAVLEQHPYLFCGCGGDLWQGVMLSGALIFVCADCRRAADQRRVP